MAEKKKNIAEPIGQIAAGSALAGSGVLVGSKKAKEISSRVHDRWAENVAGGKRGQRKLNFFSGNQEINFKNKIYNKALTKASGDKFFGDGIGAYDPLTKRSERVRFGGFAYYIRGKKAHPKIRTNYKNLSIILHELGHDKQYKVGGHSVIRKSKILDKIGDITQKHGLERIKMRIRGSSLPTIDTYYIKHKKLDKLKRGIKHFPKFYTKKALHDVVFKAGATVMDLTRIGFEMEANINAVKYAHKLRGRKFATITAKAMLPNVVGYSLPMIHKAGKAGLILAGLTAVGFGIKKLATKKTIQRKPARKRAGKIKFVRIRGRIVPIRVKK